MRLIISRICYILQVAMIMPFLMTQPVLISAQALANTLIHILLHVSNAINHARLVREAELGIALHALQGIT